MLSHNQKNKKIFFVILAAFVLSAPIPGARAGEHDHSSMPSEDKKELYHCPMHPQIISDKPGECPICHMRLVRSGEDNQGNLVPVLGRVETKIPESSRGGLGIRTAVVEERGLVKTIEVWGNVAHDPELYALQVDYLQLALYNREYGRDRSRIWERRGLLPWEKLEIRLSNLGLGRDWVEALEKAGEPDKRLLLHEETGRKWVYTQFPEKTPPGAWVYAKLQEKDMPFVKKGDAVTVRFSAQPGVQVPGRVEFIDNIVDDMNRTVRARILISEMPKNLRPHMLVEASIHANLGVSLAIPDGAPLFTGKGALVFVDEAETFKPREVVLGEKADGYYQVKSGLMPGEKVAADGNFFIDSDSRLKASAASASTPAHSHGGAS